MTTPIVDFVKKYAQLNSVRAHMPGHKGQGDFCESFDITEIDGADCLYSAKGIIAESEKNASILFNANTFYSTEGSTLSIRAMLYLALQGALAQGKRPLIASGRNAHKSFLTTCAMLGFDVEWIYPKNNADLLDCQIDLLDIENYFERTTDLPCALYLTTPDYLGNVVDLSAVSKLCKKHGVLLLIDNAHGAYLKFLSPSLHPIDLGADMCCDSAHKTLPTLTGGAYLHLSKNLPPIFSEKAKYALSVFGSTSPSYLILQSLDQTNQVLSSDYPKALADFIEKISKLKQCLIQKNFALLGQEPLKITVNTKQYGYLGTDFSEILKQKGIFVEYYDSDYVVLMLSPSTSDSQLKAVYSAFTSIKQKAGIKERPPKICEHKKSLSPREAVMQLSETVTVENALGRICAAPIVNCPPAIPIIVSGEVIDQNAIECFNYYGIKEILVVK